MAGVRRTPASPLSRTLTGVAGLAALLAAWSLAAIIAPDARAVASPLAVVVATARMMVEPFAGHTLLGHLVSSLWRFGAGFGLAALIGIPLGLLMGWFKVFDAVAAPPFNLWRYIAPIAWVPFAILWFGTGIGGPILIIFSGAFAACVIGAHGGANMADRTLIEAARTLGASDRHILLEVILPSAVPAIVSALRVAAGNAWQSLVGAELIVASSGIAYIMVRGQMNRTITVVMVGMLTIGVIGLLLEWTLRTFEHRVQRRYGRAERA